MFIIIQIFDVSNLIRVLSSSSLNNLDINIDLVFSAFMKGNLNLKLTYLVVEQAFLTAIRRPELLDRSHGLLLKLKEDNDSSFNQTVSHILKISANDEERNKILEVITGKLKYTLLVANFGDKEYTLFGALGSQNKITKTNALQAISQQDFINKLSKNEAELVLMSLNQIIALGQDEDFIIQHSLEGLEKVLAKSAKDIHDYEFEVLEAFLDANSG